MMQMKPFRPICKLSIGRGLGPPLLILVTLCIAAIARADDPAKPEAASLPPVAQEAMDRMKREFRKARFYKPNDPDETQVEHRLAPLIVEERADAISGDSAKLGTDYYLRRLAQSGTVLYASAQVVAMGQRLEQLVFLWWYVPNSDSCGPLAGIPRGIRIVLGPDGMPLLWETLGDSSAPRFFFVSQSLEFVARKQFGEPLPGRSFSIERSLEETPNIIVAGILDDGPVPMGPYVYVEASEQRSISTVHCRCSVSQFDEVVETIVYQLFPLDTLDDRWLLNQGGVDKEKLLKREILEGLFRWPKM